MVYLGTYEFRNLNIGKIIPKGSFMNAYVEEINELEKFRTYNKILRKILDAKYKSQI